MSTSALYPPHPAEGRPSGPQFEELTAIRPWPVSTAAAPLDAPPAAPAHPAFGQRLHWLAHDPSTNGQYPLD